MSIFKNKYRIESNRLKNWNYSDNASYFITICCANRECLFGEIVNDKMVLNKIGVIVSDEIFNSIEIRDKWIFHNWIIMPNHIHFLIEIDDDSPKYNYSAKRVLDNDVDLEIFNLFLNNSFLKNRKGIVEKHCNASLSNANENENLNYLEEKHCGASLHNANENENLNNLEEKHCGASQPQPNQPQPNQPQPNQPQPNQPKENPNFFRRSKSISSFVGLLKSRVTKQINDLNANKDSVWQANYHDHIVRNEKEFQTIFYYIQNNPKNWDKDSLKK